MPRPSERWTRELSQIECSRRRWHLESTSWTERYVVKGRTVTISRDLFGIADGIAFTPEGETVAIQWTSSANLAARCKKIAQADITPRLLAAGWRILVWSWRGNGKLTEREILET